MAVCQTTFRLHPGFSLLTANSPDIAALMGGIRDGATLISRKSGVDTMPRAPQQWLMCETAGSGGPPKVIRRNPASWIRSFEHSASKYGIDQNATYATFGPLGHSLTLYAAMEAMALGASLCNLIKVSPRRQATILRDNQTTVVYATPTQLKLLLKGAEAASVKLFPSIEFVFCGGGKLTPELRDRLAERLPSARIFEFYGASETSFVTISDGTTPHDSVGPPYPEVRIGIGDSLSQSPFSLGEIWVQSPYLFDGYVAGGSTDTKWKGNALTVGEFGYLDPAGRLFLQGRKSRMITVADINVSLESIENVIAALEGVEFCAALAKPDASRGQVPICIIQPAGQSLDTGKIASHCRNAVGAHAAPHEVHLITDMPLLKSGKPDLLDLAKRYGVNI